VKKTNKALLILSVMLVAMMASACSMNKVLPEAADEEAMMVEVRGAIADAVPGKTFDLGVDVTENGVVTLTGEVDSASDRDAIVTRVGQVKGVRSVNASGLRVRM
jgi:osmotically-inducible protein OsmY